MIRLLAGLLFLAFWSCTSQKTLPASSSPLPTTADRSFFNDYWSGDLRFNDYHLPLGFDIEEDRIRFDNPVQGGNKVVADSSFFEEGMLTVHLDHLRFIMDPLSDTSLQVTLFENDDERAFVLWRNKTISEPDRPQHPAPTDVYQSQVVTFANSEAEITLEGTLTIREKRPDVLAILLTGSGPQDRDETIFQHRPFAVIADVLTKRGLGVLRFDDRGTGKSEGAHNFASSFDFATDAAAAYEFLAGQYPDSRIGLIGHSEGAIIAQIADSIVGGAAFHIYLAGPGVDIIDLMVEQNALVFGALLSKEGMETYVSGLRGLFELIISDEELSERQTELNEKAKALYNSLPEEDAKKIAPSDMVYAMSLSQLMYLKWWPYFLSYKPSKYLAQIKAPILALNGEKDIQVPPRNLEAISRYAHQSEVAAFTLEETNHLFQRCHTCKISEYGMLTETFSPYALDAIVTWLAANEFIEDQ